MKKTLTTNGNTWQLYLTKTISQFLGLTPQEYTVQFKITNKTLYVEKYTSKQKEDGLLLRKLIKRSAGFGLNFPISVLELLEINPEEDLVDINIEGNKLIIKKAEN